MKNNNVIDVTQYIDSYEEERGFDKLVFPTKLEYFLATVESCVTIAIGMGAMFLFAVILMAILQ